MKIRHLLVPAICAFAVVLGLNAQDAKKDDQTPLGAAMEKINGAYRALGRQVDDASKNEDSLKQVAIIRAQAEAALKLEPAKKASIPAAEQPKFVADYQAKMKSFIADLGKLEAALQAGNNAEAKNVLATLKQDQGEAHKEFKQGKKKG